MRYYFAGFLDQVLDRRLSEQGVMNGSICAMQPMSAMPAMRMARVMFAALSLTPTCTFEPMFHAAITAVSLDAKYAPVWSSSKTAMLKMTLRRQVCCEAQQRARLRRVAPHVGGEGHPVSFS